MNPVRIGVTLPSHGGVPQGLTAIEAARAAERMGFDSVWMSDHVVMVENAASPYPFDDDGAIRWAIDHPMFDALISLAAAAAVTDRVELGTSVLIAPMRNPVVLAKQAATLDVLARGRLSLGVGVGWLAEEFAALGAPFSGRGRRLDEWMSILRDCWTGRPPARDYRHWRLPPGVLCYPTPAHDIPILAGGMSRAALRRVGRRADGWVVFQYTDEIEPDAIAAGARVIEREAIAAGRRPPARLALQCPGPVAPLAARLPELAAAGVTDVITSADWTVPGQVRDGLETLRRAGG